jgi:hypothetical protein
MRSALRPTGARPHITTPNHAYISPLEQSDVNNDDVWSDPQDDVWSDPVPGDEFAFAPSAPVPDIHHPQPDLTVALESDASPESTIDSPSPQMDDDYLSEDIHIAPDQCLQVLNSLYLTARKQFQPTCSARELTKKEAITMLSFLQPSEEGRMSRRSHGDLRSLLRSTFEGSMGFRRVQLMQWANQCAEKHAKVSTRHQQSFPLAFHNFVTGSCLTK